MEPGDASHAAALLDRVAEAEAALDRGEPVAAFELLTTAARDHAPPTTTDPAALARLTGAYAAAARHVGAHDRVIEWIEQVLPVAAEPRLRATLLRARIWLWSRLDTQRVLELEPEARAAAEEAGDDEGVASVLATAAFAAYRRGDVRRCRALAEHAAALVTTSHAAQYQAVRAQLFAATAAGELEATLAHSMKARALARELGRTSDIANESNNLAETYLELGHPHEARACAETGAQLSRQVGHVANEVTARVFGAIAAAETGDIDAALEAFDGIPALDHYPLVMIDSACAHAYWLLERGAAGDARRARERAAAGLELAQRTGTAHRLTALHASLARACAREADDAAARDELEKARRGADKVEPSAHSLLALAAAEVLAASDSARSVILGAARARILRAAARREDPYAFCTHVRHNRRLLELTGGVPADLPHGS